MLSMSAADEAELEAWRSRYGRCRLPSEKLRPQTSLETVLERLPPVMSLMLQARMRAGGWLGTMRLEASEVASIESSARMSRTELMVMLLDVASALAQGADPGEHIGAVVEGGSGALYIGAPLVWNVPPIKFSVHGVQAAVMSAWNRGESSISSIMVEVPPCACCRQFLRELNEWKTLKILQATDGPTSLEKGAIKPLALSMEGLRLAGIKARLMGEPKRNIAHAKSQHDLIRQAAEAAAISYAPYSKNYAGAALRTKRGDTHRGCYIETRESVSGVLAVESALVDLALGGGSLHDVGEIILVEIRGAVTQFSATQRLAQAMGNVPFRFIMAT